MYQIIASTYGQLELHQFDMHNHSGTLLSGSTALKNHSDFGEILIQEYITDKFTIHYNEFSFFCKTKLSVITESRLIEINASIKAKFHQNITGYKALLKEGQYCIFPAPAENSELVFEAGKEYQQFSMGFQHSFLDPLIPLFPILEKMVKREKIGEYLSITRPYWLNGEMNSIIKQVLNCPYVPNVRDFFFEDKMEDLLFYMLVETGKVKPVIKHLSSSDIDKIYAIRTIILNDLSDRHTISKLSRKVGLNEFKLKTGFKELFGMGPFAFLKTARMNSAYDLLLNPDLPIKEIAMIAGYESLTSFVGAFRKFFGKTPGQIRYNK